MSSVVEHTLRFPLKYVPSLYIYEVVYGCLCNDGGKEQGSAEYTWDIWLLCNLQSDSSLDNEHVPMCGESPSVIWLMEVTHLL